MDPLKKKFTKIFILKNIWLKKNLWQGLEFQQRKRSNKNGENKSNLLIYTKVVRKYGWKFYLIQKT